MAIKVPALLHKMSKSAQKAWYKKQGMEMPDEPVGKSAAAAKKVKVAPRKMVSLEPGSVRALNAARQQAYMAKGGRQPIGAMGSGGSNVMAGAGQSTVKDLKASIKAGFNPRVSLDPYESERAKKTGPRSLKMKNEEVQVDEAMSPEAAKKKRIFDLKLKMIKKVANYKSRTKSSKVDEPHSSLNPASDMKLNPRAPSGGGKNYYKEETQIDEVTGYEGVKDRKDIIKRAAAMNRMGKDVFLARVKARAAEIKKEKASKELAKEEVQIDEVTKKEAEVALGGPVKDKPKGPAGKLPLGYRMARSAARRAMKGAVSAVHKSMEKTMQKEDVNEAVKDAADVGEYDYEGDMAKSQLRSIAYNSKMLHDMLEDNTNLPEWVQSKITLAEDYIMTAANYMRGEMMNEESEDVNAVHASMEKTMKKDMEEDLPFDPTGVRKPGNVVDKSGAVHTPMSRVRHLAQMAAMRAEVSQQKPETAEDLVAQHQAMHTLEEKMNLATAKMGDVIKDFQKSDAPQFKGKSQEKRRQMAIAAKLSADRGSRMDEQMTLDQAKKDPRYMSDPAFKAEVDKAEAFAAGFDQSNDRSNDMIKPSMLPDTPTIPQGQGFGDDIEAKKKEKILNKTKVAVSKKKDNYDMVNRGALPDMPPANMQEENEVIEQEVEEVEVPQEEVIQEPIQEQTPVSDNPYVAAAAGFLNNTSNRLLYGERK